MSDPSIFIPSAEFSTLCDLNKSKARRALSRAFEGHPWRGHRLVVRRVKGAGGRSGWQYQVRLDSLPAELREAWQANPVALRADDSSALEIDDSQRFQGMALG